MMMESTTAVATIACQSARLPFQRRLPTLGHRALAAQIVVSMAFCTIADFDAI
jgi:hypothetical protein